MKPGGRIAPDTFILAWWEKAGSIGLYLRRDAPTNRPTPNRGTVRADHEGKFRGDALVVVGTGDMFAPLRREAPGLMNSVPDGRALSWR